MMRSTSQMTLSNVFSDVYNLMSFVHFQRTFFGESMPEWAAALFASSGKSIC